MEVEVQAGKQTAASFAQPELRPLLEGLPKASRPGFLRGDCNGGSERTREGAGQRAIDYLFKRKQSANVKKLIARLFGHDKRGDAGQKRQGLATELPLSGGSQARRGVVLRRPQREGVAEEKKSKKKGSKQLNLDLPGAAYRGARYEYAVLVTSLKNRWGWAGFTPHDRNRCQAVARIAALIYNWWTIFMRLGIPDKHAGAITPRPLARHGIARRTRHGNQTRLEVTRTHSKALAIAAALTRVSGFLKPIKATAEQLTQAARWRLTLSAPPFNNFSAVRCPEAPVGSPGSRLTAVSRIIDSVQASVNMNNPNDRSNTRRGFVQAGIAAAGLA
ncbi:MAG: hypothetical protein ACRETL_08815, partial [Gammaproteobacteria bacterium]